MKTGLVLEGGGLRALFTAGVTDVMMENGLWPDGVVGVSAGATFGCNVKSRQPGRALRYNLAFKDDPRYMGLRTLLRTGDLVGAEFSYHTLPTRLDVFDTETYRRNPMEFYCVCTDTETGRAVYKRVDEMDYEGCEWLRASASMPMVSRPVELDGRKYLDGGIADSIPLRFFQSMGYSRNIVVLTQPKGFYKKRTRLLPLLRLGMKKYPAIVRAMARRHIMYNGQLRYIQQQESEGGILLIYPQDTLPIGRTEQDEAKMRRVYAMGRRAGEDNLERMRRFMAEGAGHVQGQNDINDRYGT